MSYFSTLLGTLQDIRAALRVLILLQLAERSGRLPEIETDRLAQLLAQQNGG